MMHIIPNFHRNQSFSFSFFYSNPRPLQECRIVENRSDQISTVWKTPYPAMPTWTNTLPRHFCRGPASHKPFDFLPPFYTFYMFYTAKTFSVHRRVRNHYTKRILNLILNRKKFLRRRNELETRQICRGWLESSRVF